jgi:hypothetical protein
VVVSLKVEIKAGVMGGMGIGMVLVLTQRSFNLAHSPRVDEAKQLSISQPP